jgi:O-methyltransferase
MISFKIADLLLTRPNKMVDSSIISREQIRYLLGLLESTINSDVCGDIVEFGCFVGESSKYFRMMLDNKLSNKKLFVYDSFEGLPELSDYEKNTGWRPGTLKTTEDILINNFYSNGLVPPIITKGWFCDIPKDKIPNKISFAFLDGDFYQSIYDSFSKIYSGLSEGSVVVFHDYERHDLPGVKAAAEDVLKSKGKDSSILFKIYDQLGVYIHV